MKRREFSKSMLAAPWLSLLPGMLTASPTQNGFAQNGFAQNGSAQSGSAPSNNAAEPHQSGQLDPYGGWKAKRFEATGFFHVAKDDRWWLVTPQGHGFLSFGINHLHAGWWNEDCNREAWKKRLGIESMEYQVFAPALREWFLTTCRELGFNTAGVHTSNRVINTPQPAIAYMQPITFCDIPHWKKDVPDENFRDVFSAEYLAHCDRMAREIALPLKADPWLLGYSMTDCPLMTEEDCRERPDVIGGAPRSARIGWPRRLRNLNRHTAGKQAYVETMRGIYHDKIDEFNGTYQTRFDSFDALASAENWRRHTDLSNANETRDNVVFLQRVVQQYYRTARDAIRRYDPNHLFMGDKINANTDTMDTVLPITERYTDVIMYQMYGRYEVQRPGLDRWQRVTDKPFINGDSAFAAITPHMPRPYGPVADSQQQRAQWTIEFFQQAFARPSFVGWHYCGLIDASNRFSAKQDRQHSGLMDEFGNPRPEMIQAIKDCSRSLYKVATRT